MTLDEKTIHWAFLKISSLEKKVIDSQIMINSLIQEKNELRRIVNNLNIKQHDD